MIAGSGISSTAAIKIGSSFHVNGEAVFDGSISVSGSSVLTADTEVSGNLLVDSNSSINCNVYIGSSLSVSGRTRTSDLSIAGNCLVTGPSVHVSTSNMFVDNNLCIAGTLTIGSSFAAIGRRISVTDILVMGMISLASMTSIGSEVYMGSSLSIAGDVCTGSNLSVESHINVGDYISVSNAIVMKSWGGTQDIQLSISAGLAVGGNLSVQSNIRLSETSNIYAGSDMRVSFSNSRGILKGVWESDYAISTSDRRFKKNIVPLENVLMSINSTNIIDLLRPVAFEMIDDESGRPRYGFIAQELENVLPSLVVAEKDDQGTKTVLYQDLIALLTVIVQQQEEELKNTNNKLEQALDTVSMLATRIDEQTKLLNSQNVRISKMEKLIQQFLKQTEIQT
jgi:cytoskeletal protein CcmA (bactofilin family)